MNEELLKRLLEFFQNAEEFLEATAPEVAWQILKYEKISSFATAGLMLILLAIVITCGYHTWKNPSIDKYGAWTSCSSMVMMISCVTAPFFFISFCYSVEKLIELYLAPKYFLIKLFVKMGG